MESLRRPSVLAAAAAAVFVLGLIALVVTGDDSGTTAEGDPVAEGNAGADGDSTGEDGGQDAAGDEAASAGDGDGAEEGAEGATTENEGDTGGEDGDAAGADQAERAGVAVPAAGTYAYASSGNWSLSGSGEPEEYELPATSTATLEVDGDNWQVRRAAGERYADRFGYVVSPDGGLDWSGWVLERQFSNGMNETPYECTSDSAYYRPEEQGRVVEHDCESPAGIVSRGQVEHVGTEELTLGDGTVVTADRLLYTYTVSGSGTSGGGQFEASGEGRLDLWLDPDTGLRLREQRSIATTTTFSTGGESNYQEDVEFTLESLAPA